MNVQAGLQATKSIPDQYISAQIEQCHAGANHIYTLLMQATAFAIGVEVLIIGFAFQAHSTGALICGGVLFVALWNCYYRTGQTLGATFAMGFALEKQAGIPPIHSELTALVVSFRGKKMLETLNQYKGKTSEEEALNWLADSRNYAIFGSLSHPGRSKTAAIIFLLGVLQLIAAVLLFRLQSWEILGTWTIVP